MSIVDRFLKIAGKDPDNTVKGVSVNSNGDVKVESTSSFMELAGATIAERPDANTVDTGTFYMAVNSQEVWQSNGVDWVVV